MKFPTNKYTGMPILHKKSILQMKINITDYVLVSVWGIPIPWYGMLETKVNFAEIFSKTVSIWIPSILRVPWCFICQMNSPYVRIKWLKGYWILSTNTEMRASESWDSNRGTPCTNHPPECAKIQSAGTNGTSPLAVQSSPSTCAARHLWRYHAKLRVSRVSTYSEGNAAIQG